MVVDGDAVVNLMPYSISKKLRREDDKLVKTNLMLNGVGGNPIEVKGVISIELTIGSKSLATAFFIVEVQGNYCVILDHDWINVNHYIPSTLHQLLIQWIDDKIEVVHVNVSAYITLVDATTDWQHGSTQCLSEKDLTGYYFLSVSKNAFVPVSVQPAFRTRLADVVFQ
jgi:hypothetical protein